MSKYSVEGYFCMDKLLKFLQVSFPWFSFGLLDISIDEKDRRRSLSFDSYDEAKKLAIELSKLCKSVCIIEHFVPEKESDQPTPSAENIGEGKPMKWLPPVGSPEYEALKKGNQETDTEMQTLLARPISDLSLSTRGRRCVERVGVKTIGELIKKRWSDLAVRGEFGDVTYQEVHEKLTALGLKLKGD